MDEYVFEWQEKAAVLRARINSNKIESLDYLTQKLKEMPDSIQIKMELSTILQGMGKDIEAYNILNLPLNDASQSQLGKASPGDKGKLDQNSPLAYSGDHERTKHRRTSAANDFNNDGDIFLSDDEPGDTVHHAHAQKLKNKRSLLPPSWQDSNELKKAKESGSDRGESGEKIIKKRQLPNKVYRTVNTIKRNARESEGSGGRGSNNA